MEDLFAIVVEIGEERELHGPYETWEQAQDGIENLDGIVLPVARIAELRFLGPDDSLVDSAGDAQ